MAKAKALLPESPASPPSVGSPEIDPFDLSPASPSAATVERAAEPAPAKARSAAAALPAPDDLVVLRQQLASQQVQIDRLVAALEARPANPAGMTAAEMDAANRAYAERCGRPLAVRVQEVAGGMFPARESDRVYRVVLNDKNGHPELRIPAVTEADAEGRYARVCGLISFDRTKLSVALAA